MKINIPDIFYYGYTQSFYSKTSPGEIKHSNGYFYNNIKILPLSRNFNNVIVIESPVILRDIFDPCYSHGFEDLMTTFNFKIHEIGSLSRDVVFLFTNRLKDKSNPYVIVDKDTWTYKIPAYNEFVRFLSDKQPIWDFQRTDNIYLIKNLFVIENDCSYIPHNHPSIYPGRPELRLFSYEQIRSWMNIFRKEIFKFYDIPEPTHNKNILINRVSNRKISDTSVSRFMELIPDLNVVYLEKLTLRDQILALKDAKLVISPHGASMYNLVFCKEGTKVIEVFPRNTNVTIIHKHYCNVLGHSCITYIEDDKSYGFPYDNEYFITAEKVVNLLN